MAYSEKVIDHYENPRNVGKMDTGAAGSSDLAAGHVSHPGLGRGGWCCGHFLPACVFLQMPRGCHH